jgi:hypothetical protein
MKLKLLAAAAIGASAALMMASAAPAATLPAVTTPCTTSDFTGATILSCEGFFDGNLLNNGNAGANTQTQIDALAALGFTWDGSTILQSFSGLNGGNPTFSPDLVGISFIGIHYGNGGNSPDGTAFFKIDAGAGIDTLTLNPPFQATSNLLVYSTGAGGGVPEPATWAMLILGMGGMGAVLRRRRQQLVPA